MPSSARAVFIQRLAVATLMALAGVLLVRKGFGPSPDWAYGLAGILALFGAGIVVWAAYGSWRLE